MHEETRQRGEQDGCRKRAVSSLAALWSCSQHIRGQNVLSTQDFMDYLHPHPQHKVSGLLMTVQMGFPFCVSILCLLQ